MRKKAAGCFQIVVVTDHTGRFQHFKLFLGEQTHGSAQGDSTGFPDLPETVTDLFHFLITQSFPGGDNGEAEDAVSRVCLCFPQNLIRA